MVFAVVRHALPGEIYVPKVPAARVVDLAKALIDRRDIPITYTGIRPGEKIHEIMISEEECYRTVERNGYYVITPMLPELRSASIDQLALTSEYSSANVTLNQADLHKLLTPYLAEKPGDVLA